MAGTLVTASAPAVERRNCRRVSPDGASENGNWQEQEFMGI
jgi:hypothetical protein